MNNIDLIIPVYNEAQNLTPLVERIDRAFKKAKLSYQIIAIDDNSSDASFSILKKLSKSYPVQAFKKKGTQGKAFSILEGNSHATAEIIGIIDSDLQYPPEVLPEMVALMEQHGVVVANRTTYDGSLIRRIGSRVLAFTLGRMLLGITCDMQSGLKVFRKQFLDDLDVEKISPWALDLPLLHTAKEYGFTIGQVDIIFEKRQHGESKLSLLKPTLDITRGAFALKLQKREPKTILSTVKDSMIGSGVVHKGHRFVTHTTLHHTLSALETITVTQRAIILFVIGLITIGLFINTMQTAIIMVGVLSFIYFVDVIFNFYLIVKSLHSPPELTADPAELENLKDKDLPIYTILCPLYREAHILPGFLDAIAKLEYPKSKLDVILLFEEDDTESVEVSKQMKLPSYVRVLVVPDSQPKTKPKACNYGLSHAKGEYVVIYDAEDIPDPQQLKKAFLGFQTVGPQVKCLQAKLNYYNPNQNWLTRFFTAEYSLWFDVILTGLQSIGTTIPLGGTSNHFRTKDLIGLQGWDPFNVTEDCDLGVRLFKDGNKTAIIDSTTLEEANSSPRNWLRQRSRWIKGYMQTYLIHMRNPIHFATKQGIHALLFQLTVGGKLAFILINPILWVLTISYFTLNSIVGPTIEALYPSVIFYMAVTSLIFGNFMFIYYYMIGCAKREHWGLLKWVYLIPIYWLMVSVAGAIALYQLIVKPHYWEKTVHGLHLKKEIEKQSKKTVRNVAISTITNAHAFIKDHLQARIQVGNVLSAFKTHRTLFPKTSMFSMIKSLTVGKYSSETLLVIATIGANILNMATSIALGKTLSFEDFAVYSSLMSLLYLVYIPTGAFGASVNHKTALLAGRHKLTSSFSLWRHYAVRGFFLSMAVIGLWLALLPLTHSFLPTISLVQLMLFTPVIGFVLLNSISEGYLRGMFSFRYVAISTIIEPISRLVIVGSLMLLDIDWLIISAAPLTTGVGTVLLIWSVFHSTKHMKLQLPLRELRFPWTFFIHVLLSGASAIAFFSLDTVLAVHFLSPQEGGMYGLLGVLGKIMFFAGSLTAGFVLPFVSKKEGEGRDSKQTFERLFLLTGVLGLCAYIGIGIVLPLIAPWIGGSKFIEIRSYLPMYGLGILLYTLSQTIVSYYLAKKVAIVSWICVLLAIIQVTLIWMFHDSLFTYVAVMSGIGLLNIVIFGLFHIHFRRLYVPLQNITYFFDLFSRIPSVKSKLPASDQYRVLIFNWRDTKHTWAGGAEVYIQQVASHLVKLGHEVTIFCGNDGSSARNDVIDGVRIIRRGGQYTVYIWAAIYYLFKLRNHTDLVIDSENGIPFLTPLYIKKPIFLLIHHIHQDIFREHLPFPLSEFAAYIEGDLMPFLYKNQRIITVSDSSKKDIIDLGLGTSESISIVSPGIETELFGPSPKTTYPSMVYVGRLKPYKNIDIAIKAFAQVLTRYPKAIFTIAGSGESLESLQALVSSLHLEKSVIFRSHINDTEKIKLFGSSWLAIQPSRVEGFGITVIEANACATPVIASNVKGLRDSVDNNRTGVLVKPLSIISFAEHIERLFSNGNLRRTYSANARRWSQQYSWDASTHKLVNLFEREKNQSPVLAPSPAK